MGLEVVSLSERDVVEAPKFGRGGGASRIKVFNSVSCPFKSDAINFEDSCAIFLCKNKNLKSNKQN